MCRPWDIPERYAVVIAQSAELRLTAASLRDQAKALRHEAERLREASRTARARVGVPAAAASVTSRNRASRGEHLG